MGWLTWGSAAFLALVALAGGAGWTEGTRSLRAGLEAGHLPPGPLRDDASEVEGLPEPVRRFFRAVLTDGQFLVSAHSVEQVGTINMSASGPQWKPFSSGSSRAAPARLGRTDHDAVRRARADP
ncbi:MAG: hypothetical protein JWP65_3766 [Ramlibacter sp.]|jgi:hypothetical protein|uniref:DUF6544 family protein n=1 Tax=Ramlibacter sp. TaxID=1917967 RepID=UPI0026196482|nr:DUF6544 family protein [Ramlibacter sp.]MDB5753345.1 hypothetical protein [Ramlibacter sp.]